MSSVLNANIGQLSTDSISPRSTYETLSNFIKITDSVDGLDSFCYIPDPPDTPELRENLDTIKGCRGVVMNGDHVVMKAFPYTDEVSTEYDLDTWFAENGGFDNSRFFRSYEGALIRMFCYNGKWFVTTHRKLNAFKSKWGSRESYGAIFKKALRKQINTNQKLRDSMSTSHESFFDNFVDILDPNKQYTFLVRNTNDNRLVCCGSDIPDLYHVGTFSSGVIDLDDDINVFKPEELRVTDVNNLIDIVNASDPQDNPGIIIFSANHKQLKVSSRLYLDMIHVRGNQPSVRYRYLQIRQNQQYNGMLRTMYPDLVDSFDLYEDLLEMAVNDIHNAYMARFIHREHVRVSQAEYAVVRTAHTWYKEGREIGEKRRVTKQVISDILNEQTPMTLNAIIKKIKYEKLNPSDVNNVVDMIDSMDIDKD
jgi:hypothetical protein